MLVLTPAILAGVSYISLNSLYVAMQFNKAASEHSIPSEAEPIAGAHLSRTSPSQRYFGIASILRLRLCKALQVRCWFLGMFPIGYGWYGTLGKMYPCLVIKLDFILRVTAGDDSRIVGTTA